MGNPTIAQEKGFMNVESDNQQILSIEEKNIIERLNNFANKSQADAIKDIKFFNMSLKQLFQQFLSTWQNIIEEIIQLYKTSPTFQNNLYDKVYWWRNIKDIFVSLFGIFTAKDRLIYVGLMLIIISFFMYFLLISSN